MSPRDIWHFVVIWTRTQVPHRIKMFSKRAPHRPDLIFVAVTMAVIVLSMYVAILSQGASA